MEGVKVKRTTVVGRIWRFYVDGFRSMSKMSKRLWVIILIKLFIMFAILRVFFFPNFLAQQADTDEGRADYVREQLVRDRE